MLRGLGVQKWRFRSGRPPKMGSWGYQLDAVQSPSLQEAILSHLGPMLGPSWAVLGPFGAILGHRWAILGPLGAHVGAILGFLGAVLGATLGLLVGP